MILKRLDVLKKYASNCKRGSKPEKFGHRPTLGYLAGIIFESHVRSDLQQHRSLSYLKVKIIKSTPGSCAAEILAR